MTEVDFYVLDKADDEALLRTACRITQAACSQGLRVYVLLNTDQEAARMDDLLWTFQQDSFVAHERWYGARNASAPPTAQHGDTTDSMQQIMPESMAISTTSTMARVLIGTTTELPATPELLVNLGAPVPAWVAQCPRVAEIVGGDPHRKAESRQRYRRYREQGVPLRTHEV